MGLYRFTYRFKIVMGD